MRSPNESSFGRYNAVAMTLHWLIAVAIIGLLTAGYWMADAFETGDQATQRLAFEVVQIHKALGLTVLGLTVLRLAWRFLNPPPPLPEAMPGWQKALSHFSHLCFYGFMIGAPLLGWAMVSTSKEFSALPTTWFGLFTIPHLPVTAWLEATLGAEAAAAAPGLAKDGHWLVATLGAALLLLHVVAAVKHHYVDKDQVLARMAPWVSPRAPVFALPAPRASGLGALAALGLLLVAGGGAAALFLTPEHAPPAPPSIAASEPAAGAEEAAAPPSAPIATAPAWTVDPAASRIGFSGSNLGSGFEGVFERWRADIRFDPEDLESSGVRVEIETASAATGDGQIDGALPDADFFDSAAHPLAIFEAQAFSAAEGENAYVATGSLTLKGQSLPISLPFTLLIDGEAARMTGALSLDRLAYGIGLAADATGGLISQEIDVALEVTARRGAP